MQNSESEVFIKKKKFSYLMQGRFRSKLPELCQDYVVDEPKSRLRVDDLTTLGKLFLTLEIKISKMTLWKGVTAVCF